MEPSSLSLDELPTDQDIMRGHTAPTPPALLARTLCKYSTDFTMTCHNCCQEVLLKKYLPLYRFDLGLEWSMMLPYEVAVNMDIIENSVSIFFCVTSEYVIGLVSVCIPYFSAVTYYLLKESLKE